MGYLGDLERLSRISSRLRLRLLLLLPPLRDLERLRLRLYLETLEYDTERVLDFDRENDLVRERLERTE